MEIHGANGYLVHQFLACNSNLRTDTWGGSAERLARFPVAVATAVALAARRGGMRISRGILFNDIEETELSDVYGTTDMTSQYQADLAPTQWVDGPLGERFAYRRLGLPGTTPPLVLTLRLRGTIDHWDPAFLDALSRDREVIVFDNRGLNASTGTPASSIPELVNGGVAFIHALGLEEVDLLGWSLGGIVAQGIALTEPGLVRRLVVAGSTPAGVPGIPRMSERVRSIVTKPVNDD
ncbi:alpha/beta fold hydrolase [Streptomyces chartreusis]